MTHGPSRLVAMAGLGLLLVACNGSSSEPSDDDIVVESEALAPSSISDRFCVVRSVVRNRSSRTRTVSIRWRAFNAEGVVIGTALDVISGIPPGGTAQSESASFGTTIPCSAIARFERFDVDVFGT